MERSRPRSWGGRVRRGSLTLADYSDRRRQSASDRLPRGSSVGPLELLLVAEDPEQTGVLGVLNFGYDS